MRNASAIEGRASGAGPYTRTRPATRLACSVLVRVQVRVDPEPVPKKPASQAQVLEPATLVLLAGQAVHAVASAALNEPAEHPARRATHR